MDWIYELFEFLATLSEYILILWFLISFFGLKSKNRFNKFILSGIVLLMSIICTVYYAVFPTENMFITVIDIVIIFLCCCFFLNGKHLNQLFMMVVAETLILLIAMSINAVSSYITSESSADLISDRGVERIIVLIFSKLVLFLAYKIILIITKKNKPELKQGEWGAFIAVFASTLLSGVCIYESRFDSRMSGNIMFFILPTFGLIVINIVSFYMISMVSKEHRENMKLSLLDVQIKEQEASLQEIKSVYSEMRKIKHDLEGQYGCLSKLISSGKYEQAGQYLQSIKIPSFAPLLPICTKNDVLNAIFAYLSSKCNNGGIRLKYSISSDNIDCFSPADISVIITNLVNNAFEASIQNNASEILIELFEQKNYFCIIVKNPIKESVLLKNPNLKTTKSDKSVHGFGIESVKMLAKKYNGITDFMEEDGYFRSEVWLKLQ